MISRRSLDAALDLSSAVTEVANTRHRCYIVALTLNLPPNHFHLRIAGAVPARNKMLNRINPLDPAGYEVLQVPQVLRLARARLSDGTLVRPLSTDFGRIYLTLSGILFAGDVYDRYTIFRHLVDLGLAGPTAAVLSWSSPVLPPIAGAVILHYKERLSQKPMGDRTARRSLPIPRDRLPTEKSMRMLIVLLAG